MKPGIYENLPFNEYLAIEALSNTAMGQLKRSPRHFKFGEIDGTQKHFIIGSVVHAGRLEIMNLPLLFAVMPDYHLSSENCKADGTPSTSKATKFVKDKTALFEEANQDKQIVTAEWYEECKAIVSALCADRDANDIINAPGECELSLVWNDPTTGILCKARHDKTDKAGGRFADLKTCADLEAFPRSLARYGYHRQLAHYQAGYEALTGETLAPWIIAIEKQPPYCVQTAPLCSEALAEGHRERRALIDMYADCLQADYWPGPPSPEAWTLPDWAYMDSRIQETESEVIVV